MTKRVGISKKLRFEVFKRDRFTCQYCGAKAPDVVLNCDHIRPVADGGLTDILNLVTACVDCNSGKGARKLDDRGVVEKQRAQLEELEARREQLEMMLQWRDQAEREKIDIVDQIALRIAERGRYGPNEGGRGDIRRWLKRFSVDEVLAALDASFDAYMRWNGEEPDEAAWETAFKRIPSFVGYQRAEKTRPHLQRILYIQGILRRRFDDKWFRCDEALGVLIDRWRGHGGLDDKTFIDLMEAQAKRSDDWLHFQDLVIEALDELGGNDGQD